MKKTEVRSLWPAWLLLFAGCILSLALAGWQKTAIDRRETHDFAMVCAQIALKIEEHLNTYSLVLRSGAGLFAGSETVSREEWRRFVGQLAPAQTMPEVTGVGFALAIPRERLAAHLADMRAAGFPTYRVWPEGERDSYTSIVYLEPFNGRNLRAFGYDMYSEPVRRAAMDSARDSGELSLSGKVELVQETATDIQAGVLMYMPVYREESPTDTVAQRRAALSGWVYSPYRMNDLMKGMLAPWQGQLDSDIHLSVYDGAVQDKEHRLYQSQPEHSDPPDTTLFENIRVDFGGRQWLLAFDRHRESALFRYAGPWLVIAGGLTISLLLFLLLRATIRRREEARALANKLTEELQIKQAFLEDSEFRWRFAIEGAGDGLWDWNIATGKVFFAPRWKAMLGHADKEIGDGPDERTWRMHPEDKARVDHVLDAYLKGEIPSYVSDHRMRCKDGSYKWIRDRGIVVSRDAAGKPLRMIGTHTDIDGLKRLEISLREQELELEDAQRVARLGSWRMTLATREVTWSAGLYRLFGLDPAKPPPVYPGEQQRLFTAESWEHVQSAVSQTLTHGEAHALEVEILRADGVTGWVFARGEAVREAGKIVSLHGTLIDINERKQAEIRLERLNKLHRALSAGNMAIVRCQSETELFGRICAVVVEEGGMAMAWIGLVDEASGRIVPTAWHGQGTDYLEGIEVTVAADDPRGRGPIGTAVRENRPVGFADFASNPATAPWHARGARFGWQTSAAVPICRADRPIGALTFYTTTGDSFDQEMMNLMQEMAGDVGFALDKLASEQQAAAHQQSLIESEERYRLLIEQSVAGAAIIQDGELVYANPRMVQILGYPAVEDLVGRTPQSFVAPKDRDRAVDALRQLADGQIKQVKLSLTMLRKDGSTTEIGISSLATIYRSRPAVISLLQDISDKQVAEEQIRRYARQLEHTFIQTVKLATNLGEMRDPYTAGHEQRVAEIAVAIGREMDLDDSRLEGLRIGGYLHDVGKVSVPIEILVKPARLTDGEYALIKGHAQAGYEVLKGVDFPWPVAQIALQHHERIDGSGYPQGLRGEAILFEARIVAVADVIESMASHRPYRPGLGLDKALAEVERGSGTAYDVEVAAACLRLFREKGFVIPD